METLPQQWSSVQCYSSLATSEVRRTEMNVTASPCFPLLWFCLPKLPFCTRESNEGGTQASLFLNTGSVTVLQCYSVSRRLPFSSTLQHCFSPHFPLWDESGDSPKLRIWEQQAGATPLQATSRTNTPLPTFSPSYTCQVCPNIRYRQKIGGEH